MHPDLDTLIAHFREAQDAAVDLLTQSLGIARPASNMAWTVFTIEDELRRDAEQRGIRLRKHGYGIEIVAKGIRIDFDWGKNGEADGFDAWRLYNFARFHCKKLRCTHLAVRVWIDDAVAAGELARVGNMCFDPNRRASQ